VTKISRRSVLLRGLHLPVGGALLFGLAACGGKGESTASKGGTVCANPESLSDSEMGTRQSLGYTEQSPNPEQVCSGCAFYHAASGGCGTCDMFTGGPVNNQGHCQSWNKKSA